MSSIEAHSSSLSPTKHEIFVSPWWASFVGQSPSSPHEVLYSLVNTQPD